MPACRGERWAAPCKWLGMLNGCVLHSETQAAKTDYLGYNRISVRIPFRRFHHKAPQMLERRRVMLARPVIPGRHDSPAASRTRASVAPGVLAATATAETRVRSGGSRVAPESRFTTCPGWTSVAPAPASAIR